MATLRQRDGELVNEMRSASIDRKKAIAFERDQLKSAMLWTTCALRASLRGMPRRSAEKRGRDDSPKTRIFSRQKREEQKQRRHCIPSRQLKNRENATEASRTIA